MSGSSNGDDSYISVLIAKQKRLIASFNWDIERIGLVIKSSPGVSAKTQVMLQRELTILKEILSVKEASLSVKEAYLSSLNELR